MGRVLMAVLLLLAAPAAAQTRLITDLSQSRIEISHRFSGAELLIFGAIQHPRGQTPPKPPGIAVVLRGPAAAITVRKKARVAGIWVNRRSMRFETAPGYYAVATTRPINELLDARNAAIYEIGLNHLQLSPATTAAPVQTAEFEDGLLALRQRQGLFVELPEGVRVTDRILYQARLPIPAEVPAGSYTAQIFLIDGGEVRATSSTEITIDKTGFERSLFVLAHQHGFLYGLGSVVLALAMGLAAGAIGRRRRA